MPKELPRHRDPVEIVLFFQTSQVATKVLTVLFPYPELVESENLKIRVKIAAFPDINWTFQSSLEKFLLQYLHS